MNDNDNPIDRLRALGDRLEGAASQLGLTMENFAVIPGRDGNDVDMCQVVFSLANIDPEPEGAGPLEPDVELDDDEAAAFADLESIFNEPVDAGDDPNRPSEDEIRDFLEGD